VARKHGYVLHNEILHLKPKGQDDHISIKGKCTTLVEDIIAPVGYGYLRSNLGII